MDRDHIFVVINSPFSKCTSRTFPVRARVASEGGREPRVGVNAEDADPGLGLCLEVAEDGSKYLHVMASSIHNVDNGENSAPNSCSIPSSHRNFTCGLGSILMPCALAIYCDVLCIMILALHSTI
jgi:hypothetical protein